MRARARNLLLAAAALGFLPAASGARPGIAQEQGWAPYRAALDLYRAGDTTAAVKSLLALGPKGIQQSWRGVSSSPSERLSVDVRAAAMLHADAADALWLADRDSALNHVAMGRAWADAAEKVAPAFRRRWYLAAGLLLVELGSYEGNIEIASRHFEQACEIFPDDVPLLTVTAWLEERSALAPARWDLKRDQHAMAPRRAKHVYLRHSEDHLAAALRVDPTAVEAALRLARVRMLLGNLGDAKAVLEPLVSRSDLAARDAYLARLFLARAFEIEGAIPRAIDMYRDSVARIAMARSARIGLARLLYAGGEAGAAGDALAPVLAGPASASDDDPWMGYLVGHLEQGSRIRDVLRAEVQR